MTLRKHVGASNRRCASWLEAWWWPLHVGEEVPAQSLLLRDLVELGRILWHHRILLIHNLLACDRLNISGTRGAFIGEAEARGVPGVTRSGCASGLLILSALQGREQSSRLRARLEVGEQELLLLCWCQSTVAQAKTAEVFCERAVAEQVVAESLLARRSDDMLVLVDTRNFLISLRFSAELEASSSSRLILLRLSSRGRLWLRSSFGLGFSLALLQKLLLFFSHRTPFRATIGIQELRKLDNGFEVLF